MMVQQIRSFFAASGLLTLALIVGCQSAPAIEKSTLFFPSPPEKPRIQFLTWASGSEQVEPPGSSFQEFILGEKPQSVRLLNKPYGVAARDGVVYVCDTKNLNLARMDFKNQTYSIMGDRGLGRLSKPLNVVIDPLGYKFVVDSVRQQVVVFDPEDKFIKSFDVPKPCHPVDVSVFENEIFVLDNDDTCQIVVFDRVSGEVLRSFGKQGKEEGQFYIPNSLCVDREGYIYVSDTHNYRIQKLTRDGEAIWAKGSPGYRLGQFGRPRGLRVGPDGIVYIADGATEIVQMFNSEGQILMHFGGPGNTPGALVLPSTLAIDYTSIPYFQEYIHEDFNVEYLLFVASQYGAFLVNVYAFGSFPEGYELAESQRTVLPPITGEGGPGEVMPVIEQPTAPEDGTRKSAQEATADAPKKTATQDKQKVEEQE